VGPKPDADSLLVFVVSWIAEQRRRLAALLMQEGEGKPDEPLRSIWKPRDWNAALRSHEPWLGDAGG
jgi:hypothetical protein